MKILILISILFLAGCSTYDQAFQKGKEQQRLDHELVYYCISGNIKQIKSLLDKGANPDGKASTIDFSSSFSASGIPPIYAITESDNIKDKLAIVKLLIEHGLKLKNSWFASNALFTATIGHHINGNKQLALFLIEEGADVNYSDDPAWNDAHEAGRTPLHGAAGDLDLTRALLKHGADVNARDERGLTPLHMLTWGNEEEKKDLIECVKLLIKYGADVNAKTNADAENIPSVAPIYFVDDDTPIGLKLKGILIGAGAKE